MPVWFRGYSLDVYNNFNKLSEIEVSLENLTDLDYNMELMEQAFEEQVEAVWREEITSIGVYRNRVVEP